MKTSIKRAGCLGLAAVIVCCATAVPVSAVNSGGEIAASVPHASVTDGQYEKDEIVYVNLAHDGQVDSIYVVNSFTVSSAGRITDRGGYSEVINLTTTDPIRLNGDTVSVNAPAGKFYYEGVLGKRDIPWDIAVAYRLDGEPISGEALAGASGRLQIDLGIHQREDAEATYRDHYAVQASLSLDSETCAAIDAPDATVVSVGEQKQLSYIILPGKDRDFTITTQVRDFEMNGISINMIPLSLTIDDPDTAELKDQVYELQDGAVELDDGAFELHDGAGELQDGAVRLDDGATKLDDGVVQLRDGVTELSDGVEELRDGADDLRDGADDLLDGARKIHKGARALDDGIAQLNSGARDFAAGLAQLDGQSAALTGASAQVKAGLNQLAQAAGGAQGFAALQGQSAALETGADAYLQSLDSLIADYRAQLAALRACDEKDSGPDRSSGASSDDGGTAYSPADPAASEQTTPEVSEHEPEAADSEPQAPGENDPQPAAAPLLRLARVADGSDYSAQAATLEQTIFALEGLREQYLQLNSGAAQLAQGIGALAQQYEQLDSGLNAYAQGVAQLNAAFGGLTGGINSLAEGSGELLDGSEELCDGASELYDGTYDLQDGVRKLSDGAVELGDGVEELNDGSVELKDGTLELLDGTTELCDGTTELLDGTTELRDKTADMDQKIDDEIDEMLEEYRNSDFTPVSFVDAENTAVSSVQFVMKTAEITIEDEEEAPPLPQAEPGIWQRFRNLFVFLRKES